VIRWVAVAAVLVALVVAARDVPGELRAYDNAAAAAESRSRDLSVTAQVGIDPRLFARAARLLPRDTHYFVAIPSSPDIGDLVFQSLAPYALLPRRHTASTSGARWVLAYRVDPRTLGVRVRRVVRLGPDLTAAEVGR
jgi:hypothetical protein